MAEAAVRSLLVKLSPSFLEVAKKMLGEPWQELEAIKEELESMTAVLKEVESRKENDAVTRIWVQQVRDAAFDVEDVIDEFMLRFSRHHGDGCIGFIRETMASLKNLKARHYMVSHVKAIKERIKRIAERKNMYACTTTEGSTGLEDFIEISRDRGQDLLIDESEVVGFVEETNLLLRELSYDRSDKKLKMISLVGMGGSGKTTLANKVYNDRSLKDLISWFAWVTVSQSFNRQELLKRILKAFFKGRGVIQPFGIDSMDEATLINEISSLLNDQNYVVVLDDVWESKVWKEIQNAFPKNRKRSSIVITTRNQEVVSSLDPEEVVIFEHQMKPLPEKEAMELFCRKAFRGTKERLCPPDLLEICTSMVSKCKGLPLAIVALGGIMSQKKKTRTEWLKVLDHSLGWRVTNDPSLDCIRNILTLSYAEMPSYLKPCFLLCSAFPEDYLIYRSKLIRLWIGEGFIQKRSNLTIEETAEEYMKELIFRNLLQIDRINVYGRVQACKAHDLVRELAISRSSEESFIGILEAETANNVDKSRRLSIVRGDEDEILPSIVSARSLSTLFVFDPSILQSQSFMKLRILKLLKVLDLDGTQIEILPEGVSELFHLTYLSLRKTKVKRLPKSFGNLHKLQVLDIRRTSITVIPKGIAKMRSMRHLCMFDSYSVLIKRQVPSGIGNLKDLQVLTGIMGKKEIMKEVGNLNGLKRFEILYVKNDDMKELCMSIQKMQSLIRLLVHSEEGIHLDLLFADPPPFLSVIDLDGCLNSLPSQLGIVTNIRRLKLMNSKLSQDPFLCLQSLPNLVWLLLINAYEGKELRCDSTGFPKLKRLQFSSMKELNSVIIDKGAMPFLKEVFIDDCKGLKEAPQGIEHLTNIQELLLNEISTELMNRLKKDIGEDRPRVQHIPQLTLTYQKDGKWFFESL